RVLPTRVTEYAAKMGIDTNDGFQTVPSSVLGTNDNTVLEMTAAYDTFANRGVFVPPTMVTKVVRADGTVLFQHQHNQTKVIEAGAADGITKAMEGVLERGTAAGRGIDRPAAGKTGTTQENTDAWFIGYTPDLVTGVWTGYVPRNGKRRTLPGAGARMAAPVWQAFMKKALEGVPPTPFATGGDPAAATTTTTTIPPGNTSIFRVAKNPTTVTMPTLTGGTTTAAASKIRKAGLRLRRIDVSTPNVLPGQVLSQSPGPGAKVPSGSEVVIEATPGSPPPTVPLPDVTGQLATDAVASMKKTGWSVTQTPQPAPEGFLLPSQLPPTPGQIWQISPAPGTVVPDGKVTVLVQP
ncbi:MAG TPA: PASTA domain-containing protein, partial [Microthrixaceae bacterium]|nr:PASTA domain-containing protein [Microthrixaceae bacterium]